MKSKLVLLFPLLIVCLSTVAKSEQLGVNWNVVAVNSSWSARNTEAVSYNGKLWIMGGWGNLNDVWNSTDGVVWTQVTNNATWQGRQNHGVLSFNGKMWVIAGNIGSNEVWCSSDGANWTQTATVGWSISSCEALIHDDKMWAIGHLACKEVWCSSDGTNWIQTASTAPWSDRSGLIAESYNGKIWVMGGEGPPLRQDIWCSSDGSNWVQAAAVAEWSARRVHNLLDFDGKLWFIGGEDSSGTLNNNDVWTSVNGTNWTLVTNSIAWPKQSHVHSASVVYNNRMWLIGGGNQFGVTNDVWCSDASVPDVDTHYVSPSGSHMAPFTSWLTAATNIQDAVNSSLAGDTVLVTNGTYFLTSTIVITNSINLKSVNGWSSTCIDGRYPDDTNLCVNINYCDAILDGFKIINGRADGSYSGGVWCDHGGTVENCYFENNWGQYGGGVRADAGGTIRNSIFFNNASAHSGGAIYAPYNGNLVENCTIVSNRASAYGGGVSAEFGEVTVRNSIFHLNTASSGGNSVWGNSNYYCCAEELLTGGQNTTGAPIFANIALGDYHLQSTAGRWDPVNQTWTNDLVNSPCIDAGDPAIVWTNEPSPNGGRINMGAYGNTAEASKSWDSDADGMADDWEVGYWGSITNRDGNGDQDNDGFTDLEEYQNGTDPMVADNLDVGLVAYYPFDGDANDYSVYTNTTTVYGAFAAAGKEPTIGSYEFDGTNDYINCGHGTNLALPVFSVATWFRYDSTNASEFGGRMIIAKCTGGDSVFANYYISVLNESTIAAIVGVSNTWQTFTPSASVTTGKWHHVALVYDSISSNADLYLDGISTCPVSGVQPAYIDTNSDVTIGYWEGATNRVWDGCIQDMRIYNRPLGSNEVWQLADSDSDGMPDGWEIANFGDSTTSDGTGDQDGDGLTDLQEYQNGSDPNDANSPQKPYVLSVNPQPNSQTLSITGVIQVVFSAGMNTNSFTTNNVYIWSKNGRRHGCESFYDNNLKTLTLHPSNSFFSGEALQVVLTSSVTDTNSYPLKSFSCNLWAETVSGCGYFDNKVGLGSGNSSGVALGDIDNDGDIDAFIANDGFPVNGNTVWTNDGSGNFGDTGQILGNASSTDVSFGDVDNDGDIDAFVANKNSSSKLWLNNGFGVFSDSGQALPYSYRSVELGDLNNDGDLDAVMTSEVCTGCVVLFNDGSGVFTNSGQSLGSSQSGDVAIADLNQDGYLDLIFANGSSTPANTTWTNNGSGLFSLHQSFGSSWSLSVDVGDFNNDGHIDAAFANYQQPNLIWTNNGLGFLVDSGQRLGAEESFGIAAGDLNNDSNLDLFISNRGTNQVWINNGAGVFTKTEQNLGVADSMFVKLADLDNDGSLDAFVANLAQPNVVWINTLSYDLDFDELPDSWEITHFADTTTSDGTGDQDGDGLTDLQEYQNGSDPNVADNLEVGLVAYYPFNGNASDESGSGNNGTVYGAVLASDRFGIVDSAYYFTNAYISCGNDASLDLGADFTISARFYSEGWFTLWNGVVGIVSKRDVYGSGPDWALGYHNEWNSLNFWPYGAASSLDGGDVPLNIWEMVTVTRSNNTWSIFIDGVYQSSMVTNFGMASGDTLRIGVLGGDDLVNSAFVGKIDDVRIYNRALSSNEVAQLYGNDQDSDGLPDDWEVGYWGSITNRDGNGDYDDDGLTDLQEYQNGADPVNAEPGIMSTAASNGSVTPSGAIQVLSGHSTNIIVQASPTWHIAEVLIDGEPLGIFGTGSNTYTHAFASVVTNHTLYATFNKGPTLVANVSPTSGPSPLRVEFDFTQSTDSETNIVFSAVDAYGAGEWAVQANGAGVCIVEYPVSGVHTASVKVVDAYGIEDVSTVVIEVWGASPTAVLNASIASGNAPLLVLFDGTNSTAATGRNLVVFEWDFDGDGVFDVIDQDGVVSNVYSVAGTYTPKLRVTDDAGLQAEDSLTVTVSAPPVLNPPAVTLSATPESGKIPLDVILISVASTGSASIVEYRWDLYGDGNIDLVTAVSNTTVSYTRPGSYSPSVIVIDANGLSGSDSTIVSVSEASKLKVWISTPKDGGKVEGDAVTLHAQTAPGSLTASVQLQFSESGSNSWMNIGAIMYPPANSYKTNWNTQVLSDGGYYDLRAVAGSTQGGTVTSDTVTVQVDNVGADVGQINENDSTGKHVKQQKIGKDETMLVDVYDGTEITVPAGTIASNLTLEIELTGGNTNVIGGSAEHKACLNRNRKVSLTGNPALNKPLEIVIPYDDVDDDGVVDGTGIPETTISGHWYDTSQNKWRKALETQVMTKENKVKIKTYHLTEFGLFGNQNLLHPASGGRLDSYTSQRSNTVAAAFASDGNTASYWESEENPGVQEFVYSFTNYQGAVCSEAVIYNYGQAGQGLTNYSSEVAIFVSMDASNWTAVTGAVLPASDTPQTLGMNSVTGRFVKLVISNGVQSAYWDLAEFEVHGALTKDPDADGMDDDWEVQWFGSYEGGGGTNDFEGDDLSDVEEFVYGANPTTNDTDGDIMLDAWEVQYGLKVAVDDGDEDADGDGLSNQGEFICGSIPTNRNSKFVLPSPNQQGFTTEYTFQDPTNFLWYTGTLFHATEVVFEWTTLAGRVYQLYSITNFSDSWSTDSPPFIGGATVRYTNSVIDSPPRKFYRLNVDMQ